MLKAKSFMSFSFLGKFLCQHVEFFADAFFQFRQFFRGADGGLGAHHLRHAGQPAQPRERRTSLNKIPATTVKRQDYSQQRDLPFRRAIHVRFIEGALCEKSVLENFRYEQNQFLRIRQRVRPDELHDLLQAVFALEKG